MKLTPHDVAITLNVIEEVRHRIEQRIATSFHMAGRLDDCLDAAKIIIHNEAARDGIHHEGQP